MNGSTNYIIRHLQGSENHLLREFLYEAIYIPEGVIPPSKEVVDLPELKLYIENFGKKKMTFVWLQTVKEKWSVQYGYVL